MRGLLAAVAVIGWLAVPGVTRASPARPAKATLTFMLRLSGPQDRGATYWVSYGPVGGKFGIVRLRPARLQEYRATVVLPAGGRTIFYYLKGRGTVQTRIGPVPGNPVATIRRTGLTPVLSGVQVSTSWRPPGG